MELIEGQTFIQFVSYVRENDPGHMAPLTINVLVPDGREAEAQRLVKRYQEREESASKEETKKEATGGCSKRHLWRPGKSVVRAAVCAVVFLPCLLVGGTLVYPASYSAQLPGSCDQSSSHAYSWSSAEHTEASCPGSGLHLQQQNTPYEAAAFFNATAQSFPSNYIVTLTVAQMTPHACAGVQVRTAYLAAVCWDGSWEIDLLVASGHFQSVLTGTAPRQDSYRLRVVTQNNSVSLIINGGSLHRLSPATSLDTNAIVLVVGSDITNINSAAMFSNFEYVPTA